MEISNLPDDLVLDIMKLSSLKARAAVQTCIMSKRWKNLWSYMPNLNFDIEEFDTGDCHHNKLQFSRFVTAMLERRKTTDLHKFRLSCANLCEVQYESFIEKWIVYAVENQVRVLELALCMWSANAVSSFVFTCQSLEELHLRLNYDCTNRHIDIYDIVIGSKYSPKLQNLPKLQKLHLHGRGIINGCFFTELFSGCPILIDLHLESFTVQCTSVINSQSIKHLTFKNCIFTFAVDIYAPSLISLCFFGSVQDATKLFQGYKSILPLIHVSVSLHDDGATSLSPTILQKLLQVENLQLCLCRSNSISDTPFEYDTFPLVKNLSLCAHSLDYFSCLLKSLDNLEKLTLWISCQHSHDHYHEGRLKLDDSLSQGLTKVNN